MNYRIWNCTGPSVEISAPRWEYSPKAGLSAEDILLPPENSRNKLVLAQRTCPKCGTVSLTAELTCPSDGTVLRDTATSDASQNQPMPDFASTDEDPTSQKAREDLERTIRAGSDDQGNGDSSTADKAYIADGAAIGRRVNERQNSETAAGESTAEKQTSTAADSEINSLVGTVLDNQYQIISMLGQGGMSVVYKARHNMLRKIVAIKTMLPHLLQHPLALQRFQQEAQAASNIGHTNVITIYNFGITPEGQPYLVMDYLEGKSLSELLLQDGFLGVERATNIFLQVVNALSHAHNKGVIHRDLKPSNIILIEQGEKRDIVQIVDFGIAKMLPQDGEEATALTQTGEIFGSPLYMSPEQCKGEKLDLRADIYSMGCLMYETLTGKPPLTGDNTLEVLYKHINEMPGAMSNKEHPIPTRLETIVFKALAKLPGNRYQSMDQLEQDLISFQKAQQFSILSFLRSRWELARLKQMPQTRREKAANAAIILAVLATAALGVYPLVSYWSLPSTPVARTVLALDDDRRALSQDRDELDIKGWEMAKAQADEYLKGVAVNDGPASLYNALIRQGKYHNSICRFDVALEAYDRAMRFSTKVNGPIAIPTMQALLSRADVEYNMGSWKAAARSYEQFLDYLKTTHRDAERVAFFNARIGNCYWNLQAYDAAKASYKRAISIWSNLYQLPAHDGILENYTVSKDDAFSFALAKTRLAMIYDRELTDKNMVNELPDAYREAIVQEAPGLLYSALPIWRQVLPENSKNVGICELELARALQRTPGLMLKRQSSVTDSDASAVADQKVDELLSKGTKAIAASCGPADLYYAIALLRLADYNWKNHRYLAALNDRANACDILRRLESSKGHAH